MSLKRGRVETQEGTNGKKNQLTAIGSPLPRSSFPQDGMSRRVALEVLEEELLIDGKEEMLEKQEGKEEEGEGVEEKVDDLANPYIIR